MNLLHTVLVSFNLRIQCRSATDLPRPVPQLPDQALLHVRPSGHPTPSSSSLRSTPTCTPLHGKHLQPDQVSFVRQHLSILSFSLLLLTRCLLGVWDDVGSCNATPFGGLCYCTTCCLPRVWATSTGSIDSLPIPFLLFPPQHQGTLFGNRRREPTKSNSRPSEWSSDLIIFQSELDSNL